MTSRINYEIYQLMVRKGYPFVMVNYDDVGNVPMNVPTIAETVMWLFNEHGYWVEVRYFIESGTPFGWCVTNTWLEHPQVFEEFAWDSDKIAPNGYKNVQEAYSDAIKYVLTNLIK